MTDSVTDLTAVFGTAWHVNAVNILNRIGYTTGAGSPNGSVTPLFVGQ